MGKVRIKQVGPIRTKRGAAKGANLQQKPRGFPVIYAGNPIGHARSDREARDIFYDHLDDKYGGQFRDGRNLSAIRVACLDAENAARKAEGLSEVFGEAYLSGSGAPDATGYIIE